MPRTLWEELYWKVHEDIVNLRIAPGERISEAKLAERYEVSRAPVRTVIRKLQEEGLVVIKPQSGTVVQPICRQIAKDIMEIRQLLEPFAAERAASNITDSDLSRLDEEFERLSRVIPSSTENCFVLNEVDAFLHRVIWKRSGNRVIGSVLEKYHPAIHRTQLATIELKKSRLAASESEMRKILAALKDKNPELAREAMRDHVSNISLPRQPEGHWPQIDDRQVPLSHTGPHPEKSSVVDGN